MNRPIVLNDSALEAMLARRAARVSPDGLPASIAQSIAAAPKVRPWPFGKPHWLGFPAPTARTLSLVAAVALLVALLGTAAIVAGLFEQPRTPGPSPTPASIRLGGPTGQRQVGLVAVSAAEAWAADGEGVWHFVDGRWDGPMAPDGLATDELTDVAVDLGRNRVAIAARPGIAVLEAGKWTWAWRFDTEFVGHSVAFAPDGSLWTFGVRDASSRPIVRLQEIDGVWRRTVVDCPLGGAFIAATSDGAIWTGGFAYSGTWGLARYDGARCTAVHGIAATDLIEIVDLDADASGGLAAAVFEPGPGASWRESIMRFDGSAWHTLNVDEAVDSWRGDLAVTPSGEVYLSRDGEILRYDAGGGAGGGWHTVASIGPFIGDRLSVAPDGSIWYSAALWGVWRIVPATP